MSPSLTTCFKLIYKNKMLENIVYHSFKVCHVAEVITENLKNSGVVLDSELIKTSALLHDITKTRSIKTGELHAHTGCELLKEEGYKREAEIVRQHVRLDKYSFDGKPLPEEIVNYSDKRVLHDEIVSLDKRMAYIIKRYGKDAEKLKRLEDIKVKTRKLENKIFRFLPFEPDELHKYTDYDKAEEYFNYVKKEEL